MIKKLYQTPYVEVIEIELEDTVLGTSDMNYEEGNSMGDDLTGYSIFNN